VSFAKRVIKLPQRSRTTIGDISQAASNPQHGISLIQRIDHLLVCDGVLDDNGCPAIYRQDHCATRRSNVIDEFDRITFEIGQGTDVIGQIDLSHAISIAFDA
jgi:hypothetical protein